MIMLKLVNILVFVVVVHAQVQGKDLFQLSPFKVQMHPSIPWRSCGSLKDSVHLLKLDFQPSTFHFPQKMHVSYAINITQTITAPVHVNVKLKRKVGSKWVKVPCMHHLGTCHYQDFCKVVSDLQLPFKCPINPTVLKEDNVAFDLPKLRIPNWMLKGKYQVSIDAAGDKARVGCFEFYFKIL